MKYWEKWVGDWKRKTAHLTIEQRGAYSELLDHTYSTERPLPLDHEQLYRITGARGKSECAAIDLVIAEFFVRDDAGYHNPRAQEEIDRRQQYIARQTEFARQRWERERAQEEKKPRTARGNGEDQEPPPFALPEWIDPEQWRAWIATRPARARKAKSLEACIKKLTAWRALGHDANAIIAESLSNGWQGLFAPKSSENHHAMPPSNIPAGCIKCRTCGAIVGSYTDGQCDPCWRAR